MFARLSMLSVLALSSVAMATGALAKESGLPQLNAHDYPPQLIWLAITFGVLYFVMSRITLPRIGSVIEERQNRIQRDLDEAERLKNETETAIATYEQSLAEARNNAGAIAREQREKISAEVERERGKAETELAAKLADAESRMTEMKIKAMANVNDIASDTVESLVEKLIGQPVSSDELKAALPTARGE